MYIYIYAYTYSYIMYIYTPKKELTVTGPILLIFLMGGQLSSNAWQVTTSGAHHWSVSGPLKPNLSRQLWRGEHGNPRGLPQFTWKSLVMNLNPSTFMFWLVCCGLHFQLLRKFRPLSWKWEPFQRQIPCCTLVHSAKLPASSYQRYTQILHPKSPCSKSYLTYLFLAPFMYGWNLACQNWQHIIWEERPRWILREYFLATSTTSPSASSWY